LTIDDEDQERKKVRPLTSVDRVLMRNRRPVQCDRCWGSTSDLLSSPSPSALSSS
jgi:hypothetical protein